MSYLVLEGLWSLLNQDLLCFELPLLSLLIICLGVINNLIKSSERSISSLALVIALHFTPFDVGFPTINEIWISNLIAVWPVVFDSHLVSNIKFRLLGHMLCFEGIGVSCEAGGVSKFHFVVDGPVLCFLFQLIQTLASWISIKTLLKSPIKLVFTISSKLGKFGSMNSKNLISKFLSHVFNHFFYSPFFQSPFIK